MAKTCKSNGLVNWVTERPVSGERVRNRQVTYLKLRDNVVSARILPKGTLIPDNVVCLSVDYQRFIGVRAAYLLSASW